MDRTPYCIVSFLGGTLPGRYLTDQPQRHWTGNQAGHCLLPSCTPSSTSSLDHLLLFCPALKFMREKLFKLCNKVSQESEQLSRIINTVLFSGDQQTIMQFLIDCSTLPEVIRSVQIFGHHILDRLMYVGRTWCYNIHRERMRQIGLLKFRQFSTYCSL